MVRSFVRSAFVRPRGVRPSVWSSGDSFSSIWAAFTLTVHINALCNERVHGNEEHATLINTIPSKYRIYSRLLSRTDEVSSTSVFTLG